jgi:Holliday junction DNA helicase RuvA
MIASVEGTIIHVEDRYIVISALGVGYKIFTTTEALASCTIGQQAFFWTHMAVRENSLDLYGFATIDEMSFFELLLDVSGIGPKSALAILAVDSIDTLRKAIASGDVGYLNKVSGIGKKTAEKIIIELRDKVGKVANQQNDPQSLRNESDVVLALKSLGYSQAEAREALKQVPSTIEGTNARIKEALKILGGK